MTRKEFIHMGGISLAGAAIPYLGFPNSILSSQSNKDGKSILDVPKPLNMGFHYTQQYSRRNRIKVMGLVDQSTDEWARWYHKTHESAALENMAKAGYKLIEIHFLYGFGIKGEKTEYDLTKKMVENAHKAGIKVLGYFQFFSVQRELFFIENPWAEKCVQLKADGAPISYAYDRPALCFSNKEVQDYYLKGVEIGLKYCNLDGIRLDNDYYRGCFCKNCQREFNEFLKREFSEEKARRVFGFSNLEAMELVPTDLSNSSGVKDPLAGEMVKFRMFQRQKIMELIHDKIVSLKPGAILGGNPAICRTVNDSIRLNVYIPDLGKTHQLICAENSLFPARTGNSIRHQVVAYKHGQVNNFKIFASHHLYTPEGKMRWPENKEECALSLCEALAFGGHAPCTTWGIRMDQTEDKTLYERPYFLAALTPLARFIEKNKSIYKDTVSDAQVGIYINRESQIYDASKCWHSLQGIVQLLIINKIPFKFVDSDDDEKLRNLKTLLIGDVTSVSDSQFIRLNKFAESNQIIITGESCRYDDFHLERSKDKLNDFLAKKTIVYLKDTPEKIRQEDVVFQGRNYISIPLPPQGEKFIKELEKVHKSPIKVNASPFIAIDVSKNSRDEVFLHVLNYDNSSPQDVEINFKEKAVDQVFSPEVIGCSSFERHKGVEHTSVVLKGLHTYTVIKAIPISRKTTTRNT